MKRVIKLLLLMVIFSGSGCNKTPEGILPINKMKVVFLHQIMAEEMLNNFISRNDKLNYDSARSVLFSGVMKLDKTDSTTFEKSLNYYKADIGLFKELLDSVNALAIREKEIRAEVVADRLKKKAVADSLALVDSIAKVKKAAPGSKDSLTSDKDSLKAKKGTVLSKKDSILVPPQ